MIKSYASNRKIKNYALNTIPDLRTILHIVQDLVVLGIACEVIEIFRSTKHQTTLKAAGLPSTFTDPTTQVNPATTYD